MNTILFTNDVGFTKADTDFFWEKVRVLYLKDKIYYVAKDVEKALGGVKFEYIIPQIIPEIDGIPKTIQKIIGKNILIDVSTLFDMVFYAYSETINAGYYANSILRLNDELLNSFRQIKRA